MPGMACLSFSGLQEKGRHGMEEGRQKGHGMPILLMSYSCICYHMRRKSGIMGLQHAGQACLNPRSWEGTTGIHCFSWTCSLFSVPPSMSISMSSFGFCNILASFLPHAPTCVSDKIWVVELGRQRRRQKEGRTRRRKGQGQEKKKKNWNKTASRRRSCAWHQL